MNILFASRKFLMTTECARIADQLRRAFEGKAWHGSPIKELLAGISSKQASERPVAGAHSIWELVLHIEVWVRAAAVTVEGGIMAKIFGTPEDWPPVTDATAQAWDAAKNTMLASVARLAGAIEQFGDARLTEIVPGRGTYDFYYLLHGVVQHSLYHGGQIALLKKASAQQIRPA